MGLLVLKFGGTSVGTPERICAVSKRIAEYYHQGHQLVVVVSAMGAMTDELIELASKVSKNPPDREMDMLLTAGERISMSLLSIALAHEKVPALSFTGSQSGIITNHRHRRAQIQRILGDRLRSALELGKVAIVAGFQGVSLEKEVTTLGRGGSDTSAVALAVSLKADLCEIYKDVDGVYSADPRVVQNARLWRALPLSSMVELAHRGAGVLHARSIELAEQYGVPMTIRNSLNSDPGTHLIRETGNVDGRNGRDGMTGMEDFGIVGISHDPSQFHLEVKLSRGSVVGALWDRASKDHLPLLCPFFSNDEVQFFSERDEEPRWRRILTELTDEGFLKSFKLNLEIVPLSVVGHRFSQDPTAISSVMAILSHEAIPVSLGASSSLAMTVGVPATHAEEGVRALHRHFFPER